MKFHYLARAIIEQNDRFLLVREKGNPYTFLPGGHIEISEAAKSALQRELKEETGTDFTIQSFVGAVEHNWNLGNQNHSEINLIFVAEANTQDQISSKEENLEFEWVPKKEIVNSNLLPVVLIELLRNFDKSELNTYWASTRE